MARNAFALAQEKRILAKTLKFDFFLSPNQLTASVPSVPSPPISLLCHCLLYHPFRLRKIIKL